MSAKLRVDAGMMKEHKAHDFMIEDGPPPRRPGGVIVWLLLGAGIGLAIILWAAGCKTIGALPDGIPWPTNTAGTVTTTTTTTTTTQAAQYDMTLTVTSLTAHQVGFAWTPKAYGWPQKLVKVWCDAEVWMNGKKFDWIRTGGQSVKGLENIHAGYNGHTVPAGGERVTFRWVSVDGKKRSNDAEAVWPK
jgi:hypothetical protein